MSPTARQESPGYPAGMYLPGNEEGAVGYNGPPDPKYVRAPMGPIPTSPPPPPRKWSGESEPSELPKSRASKGSSLWWLFPFMFLMDE